MKVRTLTAWYLVQKALNTFLNKVQKISLEFGSKKVFVCPKFARNLTIIHDLFWSLPFNCNFYNKFYKIFL